MAHILLNLDQLIEILTMLLKDGYGSAFNGFLLISLLFFNSGTRLNGQADYLIVAS